MVFSHCLEFTQQSRLARHLPAQGYYYQLEGSEMRGLMIDRESKLAESFVHGSLRVKVDRPDIGKRSTGVSFELFGSIAEPTMEGTHA